MTPDPAASVLPGLDPGIVFEPHVAVAMAAIGVALVAALVAWLMGLDERRR